MNYVLPQEAKTSKKFSTLPDELSSIAEKLMKNKFKEKEDVLANPQDVFLDPEASGRGKPHHQAMAGCSNSFCASCYGGIDPCRFRSGRGWDDPRLYRQAPMSHGASTDRISLEGCYELLKKLDRINAPRDRREFIMGPSELHELVGDRRSDGCLRKNMQTLTMELFGTPVRIDSGMRNRIELVSMY